MLKKAIRSQKLQTDQEYKHQVEGWQSAKDLHVGLPSRTALIHETLFQPFFHVSFLRPVPQPCMLHALRDTATCLHDRWIFSLCHKSNPELLQEEETAPVFHNWEGYGPKQCLQVTQRPSLLLFLPIEYFQFFTEPAAVQQGAVQQGLYNNSSKSMSLGQHRTHFCTLIFHIYLHCQ